MDASEQGDVLFGFDPVAVRTKYLRYQEETEKRRVRPTGDRPPRASRPVVGPDPFVVQHTEREPLSDEVDVIVVGGGFGGLVTGAHLRKAGVSRVRVIEAASGFGGVWYWNRYPGAACDTEAYVYFPFLEEVGVMPSEKHPGATEIRAYAERLADHFDLTGDACLGTRVTEARWDADTARWVVKTDRHDEMRARFLCVSAGNLGRPVVPDVEGLDSFEGAAFHSSRWDFGFTGGDPEGGLVKLKGKRVAVVGASASAIQFVPHLAEHADEVVIFQRTPNIVRLRGNRPTDPDWYRAQPPGWQRERIENIMASVENPPGQKPERDLLDDAVSNLSRLVADWALTPPPELAVHVEGADPATRVLVINYALMEKIRAEMSALVDDPATAELVMPYYNFGCTRPQVSDTYLQSLNRANVTVVDARGRGVERVTPRGIGCGDEEFEVDGIIFGTGFDIDDGRAPAGSFPIIGRSGEALADKWASGVRSLHGVQVAGFPNFFTVGTITQAALSFVFTHQLDQQAEHVAAMIRRCDDEDLTSVEPTPEAETRWAEELRDKATTVPRVDLGCPPNDLVTFIRSGYPGGGLKYGRVLRLWRDDGGFERDLRTQAV
ncbi:flavin-containing monooxygenase [Umezawaea endophytica]|uniref:NAD(P)/FAD-dependent oxidoreductase n=1 Tax=Umezawaea endophytica TaxID=1654476 RepID=A0A9X3A632_9PSEU|nr:NAD(P)/FAD-dependent oxidoreductase [Umezawaea endophytica]MCS7482953.1 NAD(P)/FAD-dependent oxidoreductase [Umezawaea endophytica]